MGTANNPTELDADDRDRLQLAGMADLIRADPNLKIHAVLIERAGRLVYEEYFAGDDQRWGQPIGHVVFDPQTKHDLRSITKRQRIFVLRDLDAAVTILAGRYNDFSSSPSERLLCDYILPALATGPTAAIRGDQ